MNMKCHQRNLVANVPSHASFLMKETRSLQSSLLDRSSLAWFPRTPHCYHPALWHKIAMTQETGLINLMDSKCCHLIISNQKKRRNFPYCRGLLLSEESRAFALSCNEKMSLGDITFKSIQRKTQVCHSDG